MYINRNSIKDNDETDRFVENLEKLKIFIVHT